MRQRRPSRVKGFPYRGSYGYHLRFSTDGRVRLFTDADRVTAAREQIQRTADGDRFALLAYCFMPDHLHLVIEGTDQTSDMRHFAKIAKQRVAYVFRTQFAIATTWQEGYYERVLRADEATEVAVRYVLDNPVRAGLVARAEDYPFSGAMYWPEAC